MVVCLTEHLLDQLLEGTLPPGDLVTVRAHLRACVPCQSTLDSKIEIPLLRDWTPAARRHALNQTDAPVLSALLKDLLSTDPQTAKHRAPTASDRASLPFLARSPVAGELGLLGPYRIRAEIGRGGMGIVLSAWDENLQRLVAIKIVRPELDDATSRQRLVQEAQAAASFRHDHAVTVHAVVDPPDGPPYLVMEHLSGPTLAVLLQARRLLRPTEAAELLSGIADALAEAHKSGLIHRDVKPTNILLDQTTGRAKLTDFGLARTEDGAIVTSDGSVAGTPAYMSPEQAQGSKDLDNRTDVYSLGMTLYELLTGELPFHGAVHLVLRQVIEEEPRPPRQLNDDIPRDLETICLKALAKEPSRRYQSAVFFAEDLRRWKRGEAILAHPEGRSEKAWRWCRRNPRLSAISAALVVALTAGSAGMGWMWRRAEANANSARSNEKQERRQRERAEDHLALAKEAVDKFYTNIYEKGLLNNPNLATQKKELIADALRFYQRMLDLELEDANLIHSSAETAARMGLLARDMDELSAAIPYLKRSVELARNAVAADPNNVNRKLLLTRNINYLEVTLQQMGCLREAEECGRECATIYAELVQAFPAEVKYRRDLTAMQVNLANLAFQRGDRALAKAGFQAALEQFHYMAPLMENQFVAQLDLARIEYNLHLVADSAAETTALLEKSHQRRKELLSQDPHQPLARRDFVMSCNGLARNYANIPEKRTLALNIISDGIREARIALKTDPSHLEFLNLLATALQTAGVVAHELERHEDAERYFGETAPLLSILLEKDRARHRQMVVDLLAERAGIRLAQKRSAGAAKDRQLAIQLIDEYLPTLSKNDPLREATEATRRKFVDIK